MMFFIYCVGLLLITIAEVELSVEIAQGKDVISSRPYVYNGFTFEPSLAVDGNTTNNLFCKSCFHSAGDIGVSAAYFTIDFNGNYTINKVEIFYRDDYANNVCPSMLTNSNASNYRFKGYSIHISSTRNWRNGTTCYRDQSDPYPDLHVNNTCIGTGSYLTIYNYHTYTEGKAQAPVLELCEVKVYGCKIGYFGPKCNSSCSNCKDDTCDPDNGTCQTYCNEGWQGKKCDQPCPPGRFGQNCSSTCHNCIMNESCNHIDGHCSDCARGFHGIICDTECENKTYGYNCNDTCGNCFQLNACNKQHGFCENGCDKGYNGSLCKSVCRNGTYGKNCENTCGHCLNDEYCDVYDGICKGGCSAGWKNQTCKQMCRNGTYGNNCENTCGHCLNDDYCDIYDGTCKNGCTAGWKGETCKKECIFSGYYGPGCLQKCSDNCKDKLPCNHINGTCLQGCIEGYTSHDCNIKCDGQFQRISYKVPFVVVSVICSILVLSNIIVIVICLRRNGRFQWRKSNEHKESSKDNYELPISRRTDEHNYDHVENQTPEYSEIGNDAIIPNNRERRL